MENKFNNILNENEKITWVNNVNVNACIKGSLVKYLLIFAMSAFFSVPFVGLSVGHGAILQTWTVSIPFVLGLIIYISCIIINVRSVKNTYFAITNKRIIKRYGAFANKFVHYSLNNIGNISVSGNIFDDEKNAKSATLKITTKDFHTDTDGRRNPLNLYVNHLNDAYNAYKFLTKATDGKNESFRVKLEKE